MKLEEIFQEASKLPEHDRAVLAAGLLGTLPPLLADEDEGIGEATLRSRELDEDPANGCTWAEIKQALGR
ncbi:hypothetical protein [Haloferula sp. BvORR071]|uniref:hypothetical protein n=1 Tax=Haloferula sp. BvORR071 TaxID=1396141 RepID=UPI0005599B33|nr:hypothetical protein [Haloferula sp. BvORR071]